MPDAPLPEKRPEAGEVDLFDVDAAPMTPAELMTPEVSTAEGGDVDEALAEVAQAAREVELELGAAESAKRDVESKPAAVSELDEDLFNFGPLPGLDIDPLDDVAHEVEGVLAGLDQLDHLSGPPRSTSASGAVAPEQQSQAPADGQAPDAQPSPETPVVPEPAPALVSSRPLLIAAAVIALLNLTLLFSAMRFGRAVRSDIEGVRGDLAATARDLRQTLLEPTTAAGPELDEPAPVLPSADEISLSVAREELESGLFAASRRRLAHTLVTIDSRPHAVRDDLEARASYLLAQSWARESAARRGVKP